MTNANEEIAKTEPKKTFEEAFQRLEELVHTLEEGKLSLEDTSRLYEEGMDLARLCNRMLSATELRITELRDSFMEEMSETEPEDDEQLP